MNRFAEMREMQFSSFPQIYEKMRQLSKQYGDMSTGSLISAFTKATSGQYSLGNPYIQNRRVKEISSLPRDYSKDQVVEMLRNPNGNEKPLREVAHTLEYTAYPQFHLRKVYQELLTYHNFISPAYADETDVKSQDFWREWKLLEKIRAELNPADVAHKAAGQALVEGKVFYHPRVSVDKAHNSVNHAFVQQLPSDWTKIVGFNNKSKYTIAFNLFYFLQPGADPLQFGKLFLPYLDQFNDVLNIAPPAGTGKGIVYASTQNVAVDMNKFNKMSQTRHLNGNPDVYYQGGKWFYWVTLPADSVFTFEVDDVNANVVSPFTGLYISMLQIAQYEQIQLELVQNPLIALITGEIPYRDDNKADADDAYKLSNAGRQLFEALWYQMMSENNTSGIGLYMAPLENITMHQLAEAPSATEISTNGYSYTIDKAGMAGIIPTSGDTRAGTANISYAIESKFAQPIYSCMENMMRRIIEGLNLKYDWEFKMFGSLATDEKMEEATRTGATLGIMSDQLTYLALHDRSLLNDISISRAINASGIMELRKPLSSTFGASKDSSSPNSGEKEKAESPEIKKSLNPGGRPSTGDAATTDGQEGDLDSGV